MLYSIIPPILVILSVIGIIIFLVKKTPEINRLEREEKLEKDRELRAKTSSGDDNFFERTAHDSKVALKFKQGSSVFLEKVVSYGRIGFLKLEKASKRFRDGVKKETSEKNIASIKESETLDGISDKAETHNPEKINIRERLGLKQKAKQEEIEEKFFRPFVSDHAVVPKRRRETKSRLEELLIERIAANPKDIEAYERLGEYYLEVKNLEHSKECFKQVLRLNSTNENARYKIRKLEKILGS
jgi:hypothetical protein